MKFFALLIASVAAVNISNQWGDPEADAKEHKATMDQIKGRESIRTGGIADQEKTDAWRDNGEKTPWAPLKNLNFEPKETKENDEKKKSKKGKKEEKEPKESEEAEDKPSKKDDKKKEKEE